MLSTAVDGYTLRYQSQTIRIAAQVFYRARQFVMNHPDSKIFEKNVSIYSFRLFEPLISYATKHTEKPVN